MIGKDKDNLSDGDIIPPGRIDPTSAPGNIYADIAAQINQYTDRPDLLLEAIEKHDPGFIKGMNDEARNFSRKFRNAKFTFGKIQAYASLILSILVALFVICIIFVMAFAGTLTMWHLVGFAIFYAITQSGPRGFLKVVSQLVDLVRGNTTRGK